MRGQTPFQIQERDVTKCVRDYLELRHWFSHRQMGGAYGQSGKPDYLFLRYKPPLDAMWIEFKRPGGRLGPKQREWIENERRRGARVYVVDDIGAFIEMYEKEYGREGQYRLVPEGASK